MGSVAGLRILINKPTTILQGFERCSPELSYNILLNQTGTFLSYTELNNNYKFSLKNINLSIRRKVYLSLLGLLLLLPVGTITYKLAALDYSLDSLFPAVSYQVDINIEATGHGQDMQIRTYLPQSDVRQTISNEENSSANFTYTLQTDALNRIATWQADNAEGHYAIRSTFSVRARHFQYHIPRDLPLPTGQPASMQEYLAAEPGVQVNDPLIAGLLSQLFPEGTPSFYQAVYRIHRHLQDNFANRKFSGYTDALTALKLGEASCNGKSRLFVALARKLNIPARLVGGLIMESGSKRVSHQWVELYINGYWVPFDTINDHFAEIPAHYLTLYYGDQVLFTHSSNINFKYQFNMRKQLVPKWEMQESLGDSAFNIFNVYTLFNKIGISQNLLKILLMIPIGALVVVIFRNIIGIETFGTFLPALIAAAARETGLLWGIIGFIAIILTVSVLRKLLDWLQLLHSPKMAIMLTSVVTIMLVMTVASVNLGLLELAHITLFPIAIMAITAERFAIVESEQGFIKALTITLSTIVVIAAAYAVMDSLFLQSIILAFPETLLIIIALNLWLGRWIGMRVSEYARFRHLLVKQP